MQRRPITKSTWNMTPASKAMVFMKVSPLSPSFSPSPSPPPPFLRLHYWLKKNQKHLLFTGYLVWTKRTIFYIPLTSHKHSYLILPEI